MVITMASHNNYVREENKFTVNGESSNLVNNNYALKTFAESKDDWREYCEFWINYPDYFIDFIKPDGCKIDLYFYQRLYLRILMRYRRVFITATRGTAKTFTEILAMYLCCIFRPGIKKFICAPGKQQAAKLAQDNISDIWDYYPILKSEIKHYSFQKDYTKLIFKNGSRLDIVQAKDSERGGRRHGGAIEEIVDDKLDPDNLHSIILPLMANNRIAACKGVDPNEVHKQEWYCTTAGTKQSFAFQKMREVFDDMIQGKSAFAIGNSYELPCMHGQLDIDFINEQRESPTFNPLAFQREYESIWTGSSEESLVPLEKLNECRILKQAEFSACKDKSCEYVLCYDVARAEGNPNAQSALIILKIKEKEDGTYHIHLVNVFSFEGMHFKEQAKFLKQKVNEFRAKILIVDSNGLGSGCVDYLVDEIDENPRYSVVNDERYDKYKTPESIPILYAIKSQKKETKSSNIHNTFVSAIINKKVKMLVPESAIKTDLMKKLKNDTEKYTEESYPYVMTDILCDEIMNLEYKQSGNDTDVKPISRSINKDKFSALEYGIYWIYLEEMKNKIKKSENTVDINKLFQFRKPKIRKL